MITQVPPRYVINLKSLFCFIFLFTFESLNWLLSFLNSNQWECNWCYHIKDHFDSWEKRYLLLTTRRFSMKIFYLKFSIWSISIMLGYATIWDQRIRSVYNQVNRLITGNGMYKRPTLICAPLLLRSCYEGSYSFHWTCSLEELLIS